MSSKGPTIVGLDLGSAKTCVLVCEQTEDLKLRVAGFGCAESKGWRRGSIASLDSVVLSIKKAVEAAEDAAERPVDNAYVGVGGPQIRGVDSRGAVMLVKPSQGGRQVTTEDRKRVFVAAQAVTLPADRKVIYAQPQEYLLDSLDGIRDPVGMMGSRLEVSIHLVTTSAAAHDNVITAVNRAGIVVNETIYEALAAAEVCLTQDERELGVGLVDVGGGNSNLILYYEGTVRYSSSIPVGGDHFTNDIAIGLRTPIPEAEKLKLKWGARGSSEDENAPFEAASVGEQPARLVTYSMLRDIIEPRAHEFLDLLAQELDHSGMRERLRSGIVLVGGGGKLGGLAALTEERLHLPVRTGQPTGIENLGARLPDPTYATVVGLALRGQRLQLVREPVRRGFWPRFAGAFRNRN